MIVEAGAGGSGVAAGQAPNSPRSPVLQAARCKHQRVWLLLLRKAAAAWPDGRVLPRRANHSYLIGPSRLPLANCRTMGSSAAAGREGAGQRAGVGAGREGRRHMRQLARTRPDRLVPLSSRDLAMGLKPPTAHHHSLPSERQQYSAGGRPRGLAHRSRGAHLLCRTPPQSPATPPGPRAGR